MYCDWLEHDLVSAAGNGDAEAFAELVIRTRPMCVKVATSVVKDPIDAEDHVQTAFMKAWQNMKNFREDAKFSTWMTRIVTNECLMALRSRRRDGNNISMDMVLTESDGLQIQVADTRRTPEEDLGASQVVALVVDEMHRVPASLRGVLVAAEVERQPIQDVARQFGLSLEAAKSRLYRARKQLRRRMDRHTGRLGAATLTA
ncbi:MAG TPA: sigma-70 family RNA polymerase sigma factor [Bryobacteraceae bacterium]|nr:sigma-70 family RNA polymerase sigma factor [Bryobacteraceae bacterium]